MMFSRRLQYVVDVLEGDVITGSGDTICLELMSRTGNVYQAVRKMTRTLAQAIMNSERNATGMWCVRV